jgi:hypothetical protein
MTYEPCTYCGNDIGTSQEGLRADDDYDFIPTCSKECTKNLFEFYQSCGEVDEWNCLQEGVI